MKILPQQITNEYTGGKIALFFFYLLTAVTIVRSCIHILSPDGGAQSIGKLPLDTFTLMGTETVVLIFSLWGASQLLLGLIYALIAWRYKSLIPLMYLFIATENILRLVLGITKPIANFGAPGMGTTYVLIPLTIILFFISVRSTHNKS